MSKIFTLNSSTQFFNAVAYRLILNIYIVLKIYVRTDSELS